MRRKPVIDYNQMTEKEYIAHLVAEYDKQKKTKDKREYIINVLNEYDEKESAKKVKAAKSSKEDKELKKKQENKHERKTRFDQLIEARDRAIKDLYGEEKDGEIE